MTVFCLLATESSRSHAKFSKTTTVTNNDMQECVPLTCLKSLCASTQFQWVGPRIILDEYVPSFVGRNIVSLSAFVIKSLNVKKHHSKWVV